MSTPATPKNAKKNQNKPSAKPAAKADRIAKRAARKAVRKLEKQQGVPAGLQSRIGQVSDDVRDIMLMQAAPAASDVIRYSGGNQRATSTAKPVYAEPVPWSNGAATTAKQALNNGDTFLAVFRDVRRNIIVYDPNITAKGWQYIVRVVDTSGAADVPHMSEEPPEYSYAEALLSYTPHGPYLFPGRDEEGNTYFWIDSPDSSSTVEFSNLPTTQNYVRGTCYSHGQVQDDVTVTCPLGPNTFSFQVPYSGYWRFTVFNTNPGTNNGYNMIISGTSAVFCHLPATDYVQNMSSATGGRVLAASAMYSNRASSFVAKGDITIAQIPGEEDWMSSVGLSEQGTAAFGVPSATLQSRPRDQWESLPVKGGAYAFLKLQDLDNDLKMRTLRKVGAKTAYPFCEPYELSSGCDYLVITPSVASSVGDTSQDGRWEVNTSIEFTTGNSWCEVGRAKVRPTEWLDIEYYIRDMPQFYDNPFHLKDIFKFAKEKILPIAGQILGLTASVIPDPRVKAIGFGLATGAEIINQIANGNSVKDQKIYA